MSPFGEELSREDRLELNAKQAWSKVRAANATIRELRQELARSRESVDQQVREDMGDVLLEALQRKRSEAAEKLVEATLGSRTEKTLREMIADYTRLITTRRSELSKKKSPPPAEQATQPQTPQKPAKKNGFRSIF